ncbi:Nonaspanin (TM9SF) [Artemisia annua]|uniref:Transmembrane 9 superfamily member n=1 Tax=Artemisia annua TaxID=35608 RepID=A0A2U1NLN3_ARTAN|nr:Nonaspanin (TM9SF) [Artemisia annua]
MALSLISRGIYRLLFICMIFISHLCNGFYVSASYMYTYSAGEHLYVKVNSLTSILTELPFSYYSLPYCTPSEGIRKSEENIGQLLMGDQIANSPYRFRMNVNESIYLCTTHALNKHEVKLLRQRTRDLYQVNMILDSLPVMRVQEMHGMRLQWMGFPVGISQFKRDNDYIINHLKFKVFIHESRTSGYEIVGFEVVPCSVIYEPEKMMKRHFHDKVPSVNCPSDFISSQPIREQERISFTYEVEFVKSDTKWESRWDAYLKMESPRPWFSIFNSLIVIFSAGIVFVILLSRVRGDLTRYEELDKEPQAQMNEELSGWKLVIGDVFREPDNPKLLCVMIGDGVQIIGMTVVTIVFAALGFMSPAARGMLLTGMIIIYLLFGIIAGYVGVYLWQIIKGTSAGWRSVSWLIACFFPGIVFVIHFVLNVLLWGNNSTGAISISLYFILMSLWFCIGVPLTLLGGYLATRSEILQCPVRTNQIAREIPARRYPSGLLVVGAGTIPFGTIFMELFFILSSIWLGRFYYGFGFLLMVFLLLIVVCTEVSIVLTYIGLCVEDWQWWWKAFYASGSVSVYVFLYSVAYLVFDLVGLSGPVSAILYLGYSLIVAVAIMLASGTIGFITSFFFVHHLFSSVKID